MSEVISEQRDRLVRSTAIMAEYQWMFLRHLYGEVQTRFGATGLEILERGLWAYGYYRGRAIRDAPATIVEGRSAASLLRNWDSGELALTAEYGGASVTGSGSEVTLTLPAMPGLEYASVHGGAEAVELHWRSMLSGLAAGFDEAATATCALARSGEPWTITFAVAGAGAEDAALVDPFADAATYIRVARRTSGVLGALQMECARELVATFDASGEEAVRAASYAFGAERGSAMRAQHLADGTPIGFDSMGASLAERDPLAAIFAVGGETYVSRGVNRFDCTYCPLAEVWAEGGDEGMALGYLFDMELHRGLVESYHPGGIVRWDALKTRGDTVCRFRFTIPELVTDEEQALLDSPSEPPRRAGRVHVRPR
jgi:hypothetical protein